jgi:hypothetical protein
VAYPIHSATTRLKETVHIDVLTISHHAQGTETAIKEDHTALCAAFAYVHQARSGRGRGYLAADGQAAKHGSSFIQSSRPSRSLFNPWAVITVSRSRRFEALQVSLYG